MFSKVSLDPVGFTSTPSSEKESAEASVQVDLPVTDAESQSTSRLHNEVQTEEVVKTQGEATFNLSSLHAFLTKVTPNVLKELDKIDRSKAFTFQKTADPSTEKVYEMFSLRFKHRVGEQKLSVTRLAWNCTGSVVAVGLGIKSHPEWCSHESSVNFYNINKYKFYGTASRIINTKSCITSLAFHPCEPSLIAVGTYNGDILIWNLQKEGDANFENSIIHQEKVTQMSWVWISSQVYLFTSSLDGFIFSFKVSPGLGSTVITERYMFDGNSSQTRPGITCFAFSNSQRGVFVVGLEGGKLISCSTVATSDVTSDTDTSVVFKDPTVQLFPTQDAPVISITFSSFVEHLFCIATAGRRFTIYSLKETAPLFDIWADFEVTGVEWSPAQENAVIIWGTSSRVDVYNTNDGSRLGTLEPERFGDAENHPILVAAYNNKSPKLIAVGSKEGEARVWEIPRYFTAK